MSEARDLILDLEARGMSQADIARAVGRSSRYLRYVERGQKAGATLTPALRALAQTGTTSPAPYRRAASGAVVPVRAPRAAGVPSRAPSLPQEARTRAYRHGASITVSYDRTDPASTQRAYHAVTSWLGQGRRRSASSVSVTVGRQLDDGTWRYVTSPGVPARVIRRTDALGALILDGDASALLDSERYGSLLGASTDGSVTVRASW